LENVGCIGGSMLENVCDIFKQNIRGFILGLYLQGKILLGYTYDLYIVGDEMV